MIKNEEGYADPTYDGAYKTIRQEEKRKQDEADAARMDKAIHLVVGRIQTGSYTSKTGEKKYTTEISVSRAEFIEKRQSGPSQGNYHAGNQNTPTGGFEQMGTEVNDPQWMEQEEIPF